MTAPPLVLVPTGYGINCEVETAEAFVRAGARVEALHLASLLARPEALARARILALAGGFSFGDHLGAGRALANRLRCRLGDPLARFIADGGLVIGICNGFQTMVRLGLLPGGAPGPQTVTLATNEHAAFHDGWVAVRFDPQSPCVFTHGLEQLDLPVRHGEGRLLALPEARALIAQHHLAACSYVDPHTGQRTQRFPANPNGSEEAIAGLCDATGRLFGLMPHPEAFLHRENHPRWRRGGPDRGEGLDIFRNGVRACRA
jgi:phosphoribosylformylglycinamidine synthase